MKVEQKGWEPILDSSPSDQFICKYGGPFTQQLQINRGVIERFLRLAALSGPALVTDSKFRRQRTNPDINPDGSVTAKGMLNWGEKIRLPNREPNERYQVDLENGGFRIAINGDLILEDLTKSGEKEIRGIECQFRNEFNYLLRVGLKEVLLKDKLTFAGDPVFTGRAAVSFLYINSILNAIGNPGDLFNLSIIMLDIALFNISNMSSVASSEFLKKYPRDTFFPKFFCFGRKSVHNRYEASFAPPFEIDRLALAYGYLDWQMIRGNPLVKVVSPN